MEVNEVRGIVETGGALVGIVGGVYGIFAYKRTRKIENKIHETPRLKLGIEFVHHDLTKDLPKRFTERDDRLILSITNESYRPLTIAAIKGRFRGISENKDFNSCCGGFYASLLLGDIGPAIGKKLEQSDRVVVSIRDSAVIDNLEGLIIESTYGDKYQVAEKELKIQLKKRVK